VREPLRSKPQPYPEIMGVYMAGISGKDNAQYPGRSVGLLEMAAIELERVREETAEVSRGHSRYLDRTEGLNVQRGKASKLSMSPKGAEGRWETVAGWRDSVRNTRTGQRVRLNSRQANKKPV